MQIAALCKWVPNPQGVQEIGPDNFVVRSGVEGALDPGDEFGLEAALQIAEANGGEVTVVSMGPEDAVVAVQRGLAMGAAKGVLVTDDSLRGADVLVTAQVLAAALRRGSYDVVIGGVESTDGYTGTLPVTVAELLDLPSLTFAKKVEVSGTTARIDRQTESGYDVVESSLPAVITVTAGANEPRYPNLKGIMQAKQKPLERLTVADLGLGADDVESTQAVTSMRDAAAKAGGEIIEAGDDTAARIADLLAEAKVI
ncbi:MAG: electron transfer flavoprotein subunit beta/FixA family protein [Actinomycetota bacterium]